MDINDGPTLTLKFFKTHENIEIPKFATEQSACFDLAYNNAGKHTYEGYQYNNRPFTRHFSSAELYIGPGERVLVPTGLILDIPVGYSVRIHPRSGTALKQGLVLINSEGVIDSDYIQETFLLMVNTSQVGITLNNGDRIAQAELVKSESYALEETTVQPVAKTDRVGGMGSTGVSKVYSIEIGNVPTEKVLEVIGKNKPSQTKKKIDKTVKA